MPNCKLCNKPLDEETPDSLCETCREQHENLQVEQAKKNSSLVKKWARFFLPSPSTMITLIIFFGLLYTFNHILPRKCIPLAEQTVIEAVQSETGKTPFVSSQVLGRDYSTLIAVRYAFSEEALTKDNCPTYYVHVSGTSAQIMLVETSPSTTE